MKPKPRQEEPAQFFQQDLEHLLDQRQPLYKLANRLPWEELEKDFESYYSDEGRPALPTRLMAEPRPRRSRMEHQKVDQRAYFGLHFMTRTELPPARHKPSYQILLGSQGRIALLKERLS